MAKTAESIRYERLNPTHWDDVCALFATNRECGLCFCMNHRVASADEVLGEDAKKALWELIQAGRVHSILGYDGDNCIAWCAVDPLREQPGHDYCSWKHAKTEPNIWSIHCLYVHPDYRGCGLSTALIAEATSLAGEMGAIEVLAFPIPSDMRHHFPKHDGEFSGRLSTFEKLGYDKDARINDFYQVVSFKPSRQG